MDGCLASGRRFWGTGAGDRSPPPHPPCPRRARAPGTRLLSPIVAGRRGRSALGAAASPADCCGELEGLKKQTSAFSSTASVAGSVHFFSSTTLPPTAAAGRRRLCRVPPPRWRLGLVLCLLGLIFGAWSPCSSISARLGRVRAVLRHAH